MCIGPQGLALFDGLTLFPPYSLFAFKANSHVRDGPWAAGSRPGLIE